MNFVVKTFFCIICLNAYLFASVTLNCDPLESKISFKSSILSMIDINGQFGSMSVSAVLSDTQTIESIQARIDSNSINTLNKTRDRDLRRKKFLDSINYPFMTFVSREPININSSQVTGDLTIKGVKKTVSIPVKIQYFKTELSNQFVLSMKSNDFKIQRSDFNLNAYSFFISDDIDINLDIILKVYLNPG